MNRQNGSNSERMIFRRPSLRAARLSFSITRSKTPFSSTVLFIYSFAALILLGTFLLVLPVSSSLGKATSPVIALFTATSALSVTGLSVVETGTYWSTFGQVVLYSLFQIGGLGFIAGATLLLLAIGGRFGLRERLVISESIGLEQNGSVLSIVGRVFAFSFLAQTIGVTIFYWRLVDIGTVSHPLWSAFFHAASSFNNCGLDIFGYSDSLAHYGGDAAIILTTGILVIIGGTGYFAIEDLIKKRSFRRLALESKIVLITTSSLILLGTLLYFSAEYGNTLTFGTLSLPQRVMLAFFQAVTPRTAGFTTMDVANYKPISLFFTMFLMFVGGAAASTTGGVKVNTLGVFFLTLASLFRGNDNIGAFGRQIPRQTVYRAIVMVMLYLGFLGIVVLILSITEVFPLDSLLFESFSALSTVGLSTGITPYFSTIGKLVIVVTMFIGRLGPLTLVAYLYHRHREGDLEYPHDTIRLG